ncbi:hypothetical protein [Nocardia paucivorans]|uniref:hypothetical protein n=1 Tax=Nocardia paucivorans TaxID=114259 RepID=UPI00030A90C6|nr:hypothetical protein [Nocardia paucivorans]
MPTELVVNDDDRRGAPILQVQWAILLPDRSLWPTTQNPWVFRTAAVVDIAKTVLAALVSDAFGAVGYRPGLAWRQATTTVHGTHYGPWLHGPGRPIALDSVAEAGAEEL